MPRDNFCHQSSKPNRQPNHCYLSCQFVTRVRLDRVPLSEVEEPWERERKRKRKNRWFLLPIKSNSSVHLNLTAWKKEDFRSLPTLNQSWTEVFRRFSDVGPENYKVHPSILKTNRFLIIFLRQEKSTAIMNLAIAHELLQLMWKICRKPAFHVLGFLLVNGDPIRQSIIWPWKQRNRLVTFLHHLILVSWLKVCSTLKNASRNGEVSLKTELVLIRVHFTGS